LDAVGRLGLRSAELHYMQGVILEQRGRLEDAVSSYAEARRMDAGNVDYLVAQAECLVGLDRLNEATALLAENAGRFDTNGTVAVLEGHIAARRGESEAAVRHFGEALVTLRDNALVAEELGRLLVEVEQYDRAVAVLEPLIEPPVEPTERGTVRRALATCYLALGASHSARRVLVEYAPLHPDDSLAQLLLAKAAIATGDPITALRGIDLARKHRPDDPEVLLVQATIQWRRGKLAAASASLRQTLNQQPEDVDAHCLLGEVLLAQRRDQEAASHFQQALEIDPRCVWAIDRQSGLHQAQPAGTDQNAPRDAGG
jgi:Flp pilus assembly protein TadD